MKDKSKIFIIINLILFPIFFSGCINNIPTPNERKANALSLANNNKNINQKNIQTSVFNLFSLQEISDTCNSNIKIYVEGDGLSWISRSVVSSNPTPINPIGLKLMLTDDNTCKIYIARPCQYLSSNECEEKYWTSHRFSKKVIQGFDEALDNFKKDYPNSKFDLVGYSGGGAVVTLLAANRNDVNSITTIAGNIDIDKWIEIQNISPLTGSLNPADFTKNLENIKQFHLIGINDQIIPQEVFLSYRSKFEKKDNISYSLYEATHNCCWEDIYIKYLMKKE